MIVEDLIKLGESETLEFKERPTDDPKKYLKTIVGFRNSRGGSIIFGVKDDGTVVGVDNAPKIRDQIVDTIIANVSPLMMPHVYIYTLDGKELVIVEVGPVNESVSFLRSEGPEDGTYVRIGASTISAEEGEIVALKSERALESMDSMIVPGVIGEKDSNIVWLCEKLSRKKGDEVTVKDLVGLGLLIPCNGGYRATMAFRLLTDNPYGHAILQCARFFGPAETEFADRTEYSGSILTQADRGVEYVLSMIEKPSVIEGVYREDLFEIPVKAIREVILNAVIHRNYRIEVSPIFIAVFGDRIEITSPGGLPNGQTYERMLEGYSLPRNRIISRVFKECKSSEGWGRGLRRVFELCREEGLKEPKIDIIGHSVRVTFYRRRFNASSVTSSTSNEVTVLRMFGENPTMTIAELCESTTLTKHDAEVAIRSLKDKGVLRRVGARKRGEWLIESDASFEEKW
ncbi:divergent AAA domain-containing protein [methanogenic archaeon mixed culture ISO4-G1]|nr:divergent AAA domain-containing protein [methanogenic archaeon mixed culture ISO4-G1]